MEEELGKMTSALRFIYITLFPDYFTDYFQKSLARKSLEKSVVTFQSYNIRAFAERGKADDYPYGGGRGMVIKIEPLVKALVAAQREHGKLYTILLSPQGKPFRQADVERLARKSNLTFICGHYEGVDHRIRNYIDEEISIGDFITMGGELPALLISEAVIRAIPGFIHPDSYKNETFSESGFDYDSYTRPDSFDGFVVPEVLKSGNHSKIEEWRRSNSLTKVREGCSLPAIKKLLPNLD